MSSDGRVTSRFTGSPGRDSGRRPTRVRPRTSNCSPVSKVTCHRAGGDEAGGGRGWVRSPAATPGGGAVGRGPSGVGAGGSAGTSAGASPTSGQPSPCRGVTVGGAGDSVGQGAAGRLPRVGTRRGGVGEAGTSRIAVRFTTWRGGS